MRGCDRESEEIFYPWAPENKRCPKSQITPEALDRLGWWTEWRATKWLPWPGTIYDQPAFVHDVIMLCEATQAEIDKEQPADG